MSIKSKLMLLGMIFGLQTSWIEAQAASFIDLIHEEIQSPTETMSDDLVQLLRKRHIVFVDGIMNELAKIPHNYYTDTIRVLKKADVGYTHLAYPSKISIPHNGERLADDLEKISAKVRKPIILIGHSMGGAESVYAVLYKPSLLTQNIVEKVVSFEGAMGGSSLVEHIKTAALKRFLFGLLGEGLDSIRPQVAKDNMRRVYCAFQGKLWDSTPSEEFTSIDDFYQSIAKLSDRVFYVQSAHPKEKQLSWGLRTILPFFNREELDKGENDGLLRVEDQILDGFGRSLGVLKADHIELVVSGFAAHSNSKARKALSRALFRSLYSADIEAQNLFDQEKFQCLL